MYEAKALLEQLVLRLSVGVLSSPLYGLLALPGAGVCVLLHLVIRRSFWLRAAALSAAGTALLAPVLVAGHGPLVLPLPFAVMLGVYLGVPGIVNEALGSASVTLLGFLALSRRYWRRESAEAQVLGRLEELWRRRERAPSSGLPGGQE